MLTAACIALAVTALLAGFTGSWSPCGLSSVETIGSGMGRATSSAQRTFSLVVFSACCLIGGVVTFGGVSALGSALGLSSGSSAAWVAAGVVVVAGALDLRFLPVKPQVRNQVPERIRRLAPLPVTSAIYGLMLGLGFTTYLLTWAMWALLIGCLLIASPLAGVAIGLAFGLGRALPVVVLAGSFERESTQRFILEMETGPLLIGLRRIDGVALLVSALLIVPVATAGAARLPGFSYNPSEGASAGAAVSKRGANSQIFRPDGNTTILPGTDAALGDGLAAWRSGEVVTVANAFSLAQVAQFTIPGVNALALTGSTLAYRTTDSFGKDTISARPISGGDPVVLGSYDLPTTLSRPSISGGTVVYGVWGRRDTRLIAIGTSGGQAQLLRKDSAWHVVSNPAIHGGAIAYVRSGYCDQTLMLGSLTGRPSGRGDRVKLRLRARVSRDPGYEPRHVRAYNGASKCPKRKYAGYSGELWTTAIGQSRLLVTLLARNRAKPRVLVVAR